MLLNKNSTRFSFFFLMFEHRNNFFFLARQHTVADHPTHLSVTMCPPPTIIHAEHVFRSLSNHTSLRHIINSEVLASLQARSIQCHIYAGLLLSPRDTRLNAAVHIQALNSSFL